MSARLKIYGWTGFRHDAGTRLQTREILAATSIAAVRRIAGITAADWRWSGCETGNAIEVTIATARPGVVFWKPLDFRSEDGTGWTAVEVES